jgi:hypothetical protein
MPEPGFRIWKMESKGLGPLEQVEEHYSEPDAGLTSLEGVFLQYFF